MSDLSAESAIFRAAVKKALAIAPDAIPKWQPRAKFDGRCWLLDEAGAVIDGPAEVEGYRDGDVLCWRASFKVMRDNPAVINRRGWNADDWGYLPARYRLELDVWPLGTYRKEGCITGSKWCAVGVVATVEDGLLPLGSEAGP